MILDLEAIFSDDQDLAQTAAAYDSTNIIEMPKRSDAGTPLRILVQVTETFTSGGAATLAVDVETDALEAMGSPTNIYTGSVIALATLVAGYEFAIDFIPRNNEEFVRLEYTIGTATTTAGKVTAGFVFDKQSNKILNPPA
jgi:hypothetical protein